MPTRFSFEGIGTTWNIGIEDISAHDGARIEKIVQSRVAEFNAVYSRFREDSWVAKLSQKAGKYELPADAEPMLSLYRDLYDITEGLVTPLIGQTLVDAGYDKDYSFVEKKTLARPPKWDEAIQYEPHAHPPVIIIKTPVLIDVGAIGKGYIIDIIGKLLEENGIVQYSINAGGDILNKGTSLRVGLEHPADFSKVIGVVTLAGRDGHGMPHAKSIAGSAGNRRKWGRFHHIINPETLSSPMDILAVWAVADTAMLADAMATALYFTSAEKLQNVYDFEYLIVYKDMSVAGTLVNDPMIELF